MKDQIEKEINEKLRNERNNIIAGGRKLRGKFHKIFDKILLDYALSKYDVFVPKDLWRVLLYEKGTLEKMEQSVKESKELARKRLNFVKRIKSGQIESSIKKWIEKTYPSFYVKHSNSTVRSESFYIFHDDYSDSILKLSLHNTIYQQIEYNTPFLNLEVYTSTITLKKDIEKYIQEFLKENNSVN